MLYSVRATKRKEYMSDDFTPTDAQEDNRLEKLLDATEEWEDYINLRHKPPTLLEQRLLAAYREYAKGIK